MSLEKLERFAERHPELDQDQKARLKASVATLRQCLDAVPKSLAWNRRAKIGERVKCYNDVEEVRF